jgi:hypothetical protein
MIVKNAQVQLLQSVMIIVSSKVHCGFNDSTMRIASNLGGGSRAGETFVGLSSEAS